MNEVKRPKNKTKKQKNALYNIEMFFKARDMAVRFFNDQSSLASEAKFKATHGEGIKILTPKQMLQGLPIALAQINAGNTSENLLNEIRQIIYFLYQAKEITKKVCNNIINSIKL